MLHNELLNIEIIRNLLKERNVDWTKHCLNRLQKRNIAIADVKNAINSGLIIEWYDDDYPYPSCLVFGYNVNGEILHIVCGVSYECLHIITAYYPDSEKWEDDMKIRRKK